jgi:hypothetical protein
MCLNDKLAEELMLFPGSRLAEMQCGSGITLKTRSIVLRWITSVHHDTSICDETLGNAVYYFDATLASRRIEKDKIQLLGIVCLWMATKMSEIRPSTIDELKEICSIPYPRTDFEDYERMVLITLSAKLQYPTSAAFLRIFLEGIGANQSLSESANFLCEASLFCFELNEYRRSTIAFVSIAAAAVDLAIPFSLAKLVHCSHFGDQANIIGCASLILQTAYGILEARDGPTYLKYLSRQMSGSVAHMKCNEAVLAALAQLLQ